MKKSSGFTYIETLISMSIITLICLLLYHCFFVSTKSAFKAKNKIHLYMEHIIFDKELRSYVNSICVPEWIDDYNFSFSEDSITTQWNNGLKSNKVFTVPTPFKITDVSPIKITNKTAGLDIYYSFETDNYVCRCLFATFPYNDRKK